MGRADITNPRRKYKKRSTFCLRFGLYLDCTALRLVSPYYEEGGGTVIDWVSPDDMCEDDEDDYEEEEDL
jgi:hypothetical protein